MLILLLTWPITIGALGFAIRSAHIRPWLLPVMASVHLGLVVDAWLAPPHPVLGAWLNLDATGLLFLTLASVLFVATSFYLVGYLHQEADGTRTDAVEGLVFRNAPQAVLIFCIGVFLSAVTLVATAQHFGLIWVGIETTTLATAPLIYFHRHKRSLEATWKYMLLCSIGIALALLGNLCFELATIRPNGHHIPLELAQLTAHAQHLAPSWLHAGVVLLLVGYGTKVGLAPMHSWLPDTYAEAPSAVSALLAGALEIIAFLGIWRALQVCYAARDMAFASDMLMLLGLISVAVAAIFLLGQDDYKRLLAYSSVEHMGLIAIGVALGGPAQYAALLHAIGHALTKAALFLCSGTIFAVYRTRSIRQVGALLQRMPITGVLWTTGLLILTGAPPGLLFTKWLLIREAIAQRHTLLVTALCLLIATVFIGLITAALRMAHGTHPEQTECNRQRPGEPVWAWLPATLLLVTALALGVYPPQVLTHQVSLAIGTIGGTPP